MFVTDNLVYLELHKTGGTHIGRLLSELLDGEQIGKHNRLPLEFQNRFILGSIRNPWDWYVSLWAYGCGAKGSVYTCTTQGVNLSYYHRQLPKEMGTNWLSPSQYLQQILADCTKPVAQWQACYRDHRDAQLFRTWLKKVLSSARRLDIREGFGFSPLSHHSGLLTYRYFKLFTDLNKQLYQDSSKLKSVENMEEIWSHHKQVNYIIRNENLESDLIEALERANLNITEQQKQTVFGARQAKTNTSKRKETGYYYDQECLDLVAEKDALIIKNHNYTAPKIN